MGKIDRYKVYDVKHISDFIACLTANIEDAYRTAGIKDYISKECFDKAFELAKITWSNKDGNVGNEFHWDTRNYSSMVRL